MKRCVTLPITLWLTYSDLIPGGTFSVMPGLEDWEFSVPGPNPCEPGRPPLLLDANQPTVARNFTGLHHNRSLSAGNWQLEAVLAEKRRNPNQSPSSTSKHQSIGFHDCSLIYDLIIASFTNASSPLPTPAIRQGWTGYSCFTRGRAFVSIDPSMTETKHAIRSLGICPLPAALDFLFPRRGEPIMFLRFAK